MQVDKDEETTEKPDNRSTVCAKGKYDGVELSVGMVFESLVEAHQFYHLYAKVHGFNVHIRNTTNFPRSKEVRYRRFVCSCEGFCSEKKSEGENEKRDKKTLTIRKCSPISFAVSRKRTDDHWIATSVKNEHNHVLASPRSAGNFGNQKVISSLAKNLVENFSEAGLPIGRVPDILNDGPMMNIRVEIVGTI